MVTNTWDAPALSAAGRWAALPGQGAAGQLFQGVGAALPGGARVLSVGGARQRRRQRVQRGSDDRRRFVGQPAPHMHGALPVRDEEQLPPPARLLL